MSVESTGLPAVNEALEPAWVRHGSASIQKTYETALAFEEMLVQQLSQSLAATSGLEGESSQEGESGSEGGGSSSLSTSALSSMLPQALADGVMGAGGLGLAAQLTRDMQSTQGAQGQAGGGTSASLSGGTVSSASGGVGA